MIRGSCRLMGPVRSERRIVSDVILASGNLLSRRGKSRTYVEPILGDFRRSHLARAILTVLQAGVEVGEALHLHG